MSNPNPKGTKGMKINKKTSERHKEVAEAVLENGGKMAPALREAGYSDEVVNNPKKVTSTKSWKAQMKSLEEKVSVEDILDNGLNATVKNAFGEEVPNFTIQHKYLDTFLKITDKYPASKRAVDITTKGKSLNNLKDVPTEDLEKILEEGK